MKFVKLVLIVVALLCFSNVSSMARGHHHHHVRVNVIRRVVNATPAPDPLAALFSGILNAVPAVAQQVAVNLPRATRRALFNRAPIGGGRTTMATWYGAGRGECTGCSRSHRTADGSRIGTWTMASSFLPMHARVMVCAARCGTFTVNDRGGRFDLGKSGAWNIGVRQTQRVRYQILG